MILVASVSEVFPSPAAAVIGDGTVNSGRILFLFNK